MPAPVSQPTELLKQLSRNSTPYQDPLRRVDWDQLDPNAFWLPEGAISLYGLPEYQDLPLEQRRTLSQYEFLNFIEAALWLESLFIGRISESLRRPRHDLPQMIYRLHELREEAGHSLMFLELLHRSGPLLPNGRFYRWNLANMLGRFAPFESAAFWVAVLIGEEAPDRMNRYIRKHREAVCPAIYDMVTIHIMDEARHIAHARETVHHKLSLMPRWQKLLARPVINRVFRQFVHAFYYPGPHIYELAGLSSGAEWAKKARRSPQRADFVDQCVQSALRVLREHGLLLDWR